MATNIDMRYTPEQQAAVEQGEANYRAFDAVRLAYRARQVGDVEFLAARRLYDEQSADLDIVYATVFANREA